LVEHALQDQRLERIQGGHGQHQRDDQQNRVSLRQRESHRSMEPLQPGDCSGSGRHVGIGGFHSRHCRHLFGTG
jgi:hypothetical protein